MPIKPAARPLDPLKPPQKEAARPSENVWLSASAGSGKTQVLTARVIRLLLAGARPEEILCLTFTKAAAAEMEERINRTLAGWVQMKGPALAKDLEAIGADYGPSAQANARQLFARVLDAPGGGLQIMTIHSFCQSLLGSFPEEAGTMPGFEPIDDRRKQALQRDTLSELVLDAEARGDARLIAGLQQLSVDLGEDGTWSFLNRCGQHADAVAIVPEDEGAVVFARRLVGETATGSIAEILAGECGDEAIDRALLKALADCNRSWNTATGLKRAADIDAWLMAPPDERAERLDDLHLCWATKQDELAKAGPKNSDVYERLALAAFQWCRQLRQRCALLIYAQRLADALLVGKAYAARYVAAKHALGLVDFDDLIVKTAQLLRQSRMADWVRFKLDRRLDHVLIDEAQDTNQRQWDIIEALADDFFAGSGQKPERSRTLFAVGDFKQAIYGFQGTDPQTYRAAGERLAARVADSGGELRSLTLSQSFRSTQPILRFVNAAIEAVGHEALGLEAPVEPHRSDLADIGSVEMFALVRAAGEDAGDGDADEEKWVSPEKRNLAEKLAGHIKALIDERPVLATTKKPLRPGDIMVLLRKRSDLAALLVARLHAQGVPVAGIDRMRLGEQLAVEDLLAAIRFVLQPEDDLSLACLLVSPIIGWSQQQLLDHGYRSEGVSLWQHLRSQPDLQQDIAPLLTMLGEADFTTPYTFLGNILSGPTQGRRKFAERMGSEVLVPIEELLNVALQFAQDEGGTLQDFLDWFERDTGEIKREGLAASDEVRIMTVHGAKGLQAPVVILADIAGDPTNSRPAGSGLNYPLNNGDKLPLLPVSKAQRVGILDSICQQNAIDEAREHNRLLYVALTRTQERLILAGSLGTRAKLENSWFPTIDAAFAALGCDWQESEVWGEEIRLLGAEPRMTAVEPVDIIAAAATDVPPWLFAPAPAEPRPVRPLAPSRVDDEDVGDSPPRDQLRIAAERGKLLHGLFERIDLARTADFAADARRWLALHDREGRHDHARLVDQAITVVGDPRWGELFGADARAEVPIAALVGETVITGRIDRMIVTEDTVRIVDFKSGRQVPKSVDRVPVSQLRQMAHYVAALEKIFPQRRIEAALLYTFEPFLLALSSADIAAYKPASGV